MFKTLLYVPLISLLVVACSNGEDKETKAITEQVNKKHILSDQKRVLDQAKSVEKMLQQSADQRAKQIEEQTK